MSDHFSLLNDHQYMSLTTYRKDGTPKPTPVWFYDNNDTLFVLTNSDSYKVKRIRNNSDVQVAPCDARGSLLSDEIATGQAQIVEPHTERGQYMNEKLIQKYGLLYRAFRWMGKLRGSETVFIEIEPR